MKLKALFGIFILLAIDCCLFAQERRTMFTYSFNLESKSFNYMNNLLKKEKEQVAGRQSIFHFKGELYLQLVKEEKEEKIFAARISPTDYSLRNDNGITVYQTDTSYLSQLFYVTISNGGIRNSYLLKNTSEPVANSIKTLLSQIQFSLPAGTSVEWSALQDDIYGHCAINYSLISKSGSIDSIIKVKDKYLHHQDEIDFNRLKTIYLPSGSISITIDNKTRLPLTMEGDEKIVTQLSGKTIGILETHFKLKQKKNNNSIQLVKNNIFILKKNKYFESPIYSFVNAQEFSKMVRTSMLGNDNIETILAKLNQTVNSADEDSLYLKIKAIATIFPETITQLINVLDTAKVNTTAYQLVWRGLLGAENKESVNAIALLIWKHRDDWNYSKKILSNLGLSLLITDTLVDVYKKIAEENISSKIGKTAQIALGTMVDNLNITDSAVSFSLWQWLSNQMASMGSDPIAARQKLLVWGNTNARPAFDSVIRYLKSEDEEIKDIAILATCQFPFIEKVPALLQLLQSDTLSRLKNSAATCITNMVVLKEAIEKTALIIQAEKDTSIRNLLVNCYNPATKEKELLHKVLQKIILEDNCNSVRESAGAILKRMDEF